MGIVLIKKEKTYKLDLFNQVLPALDNKDINFYKKLSDDEKNEIDTWVLMRWLASSEFDKDQPNDVIILNEIANDNFSVLSGKKTLGELGHKELQWMLLAISGNKKRKRRKFIKPPKGAVSNVLEKEISNIFPYYNQEEIDLFLNLNSKKDLMLLFQDNGYDDKHIKQILKNVKKA